MPVAFPVVLDVATGNATCGWWRESGCRGSCHRGGATSGTPPRS